MFGNKGIIFIIDLIVASAIIIIALIFFSQIKPGNTLKQQSDLVYLEAQEYLMNVPNNTNIDTNKDYFCRNYVKAQIKNNNSVAEDKNVCTNVIG